MNSTDFNQLLMFHAIVNEGNISKAAKKLGIASPSVSNGLKALEQSLGLPLFTRTTRTMELTDAGRLLYQQTHSEVFSLNLAFESVGDLSREPSGAVRITMPKFVYQYFLKPHIAEFCRRHPQVKLELSLDDGTVDILADGFDLGIRFGERVDENMIARQMLPPVQDALFASPDYLKRFGTPKTPADLSHHRLIKYRFITSKQLAPLVLTDHDEAITVEMPTALIANDPEITIDATINGLGVGRVIKPIVAQHFTSGALVPILENHWHTYSGLYIYFHQNTQKAKRVRVLIDFILEKSKNWA